MAEIIEQADLAAALHAEESESPKTVDPTENSGLQAAPELNRENLVKAFAAFADLQKVSIISLIKLLIPKLENKQVLVTMTRQQEEFIGDVKIEWQAHLKQYFKDPAITLQFQIDDVANTRKQAYTAAEQYEEMLEENELFRKMVNQFKLKLKQ